MLQYVNNPKKSQIIRVYHHKDYKIIQYKFKLRKVLLDNLIEDHHFNNNNQDW